MTRWTSPTNPDFYELHKSAIKLYGVIALIVQAIWVLFSSKPAKGLVLENVEIQFIVANVGLVVFATLALMSLFGRQMSAQQPAMLIWRSDQL